MYAALGTMKIILPVVMVINLYALMIDLEDKNHNIEMDLHFQVQ